MRKISWKRFVHIFVLAALLAPWLTVPAAALALETTLISHQASLKRTRLASSLSLPPTGNTTLQQAHPNTNFSGPNPLTLGRIDGGRTRSLIKFNIGEIPLGAAINSATLRVYQAGWYDVSGSLRTVYADRVTSAWHEAVATWNYAPTIGGTAGSVKVRMQTGWYEIDITDLVRDWYTGTIPNYGLLLRGYEGSGSYYRQFVPRMYVNQPELVVDYTLQPATLSASTNAISFHTDGQKVTPTSYILRVRNSGTGVINWSISSGATPWLAISPNTGSNSASYATPVEISIVPDTLSVGIHTAQLTITAPGAQDSPQLVEVTVHYSSDPMYEVYIPLVMKKASGGVPSPDTGGKTVALLIGISDYLHLDPPSSSEIRTGDWEGGDLINAHQDPNHVFEPVIAFAGAKRDDTRVVKEEEATRAGIEQASDWVDGREEQKPCTSIGVGVQSCNCEKAFVSYSGHGAVDAGGTYLIAAQDTNAAGGFFSNAIPAATLDNWLDDLDAQNVFVAIDACFSGGMLPALDQSRRFVIASARSNQSAFETNELNGGVFTYYLVQGLMDPSADTNGDGYVSAEEVFNYAAGRTDSYVYDITEREFHQNPQRVDGVPGHFRLTKLPAYSPMPTPVAITAEEGEQPDAVFLSSELDPLPITVAPLQ